MNSSHMTSYMCIIHIKPLSMIFVMIIAYLVNLTYFSSICTCHLTLITDTKVKFNSMNQFLIYDFLYVLQMHLSPICNISYDKSDFSEFDLGHIFSRSFLASSSRSTRLSTQRLLDQGHTITWRAPTFYYPKLRKHPKIMPWIPR